MIISAPALEEKLDLLHKLSQLLPWLSFVFLHRTIYIYYPDADFN